MPVICQCFKLHLHIPPGNRKIIHCLHSVFNFIYELCVRVLLLTGHAIHADSEILPLEVISSQKFP